MFTELSLSSGHRDLYMYQVSSSTVFLFVSYMSPIMYCSRLFVVVFRIVYILLNMTLFVGSPRFISPPSFMFVGAVVSEYTIMLATYIHSTTVLCVHTYPFIMSGRGCLQEIQCFSL